MQLAFFRSIDNKKCIRFRLAWQHGGNCMRPCPAPRPLGGDGSKPNAAKVKTATKIKRPKYLKIHPPHRTIAEICRKTFHPNLSTQNRDLARPSGGKLCGHNYTKSTQNYTRRPSAACIAERSGTKKSPHRTSRKFLEVSGSLESDKDP